MLKLRSEVIKKQEAIWLHERAGLQDLSETCQNVWFGDGGNEKIGCQAELTRMDRIRYKDSSG